MDPLKTTYRGYVVYQAGPLTQGPYLSQTLRLLEGFDLKKMGFNSADYIHTVIEAEKLALADRDEYYGDPNFAKVPMQLLLSDQYTKMRRELIDPKRASLELRPGDPYNIETDEAADDHRPLAWRNHRYVCDRQVWERHRGDSQRPVEHGRRGRTHGHYSRKPPQQPEHICGNSQRDPGWQTAANNTEPHAAFP